MTKRTKTTTEKGADKIRVRIPTSRISSTAMGKICALAKRRGVTVDTLFQEFFDNACKGDFFNTDGLTDHFCKKSGKNGGRKRSNKKEGK